MERLFKRQFWDYSSLKLTRKFTYKNRISLVSSLFFGACAVFVAFFLYEFVSAYMFELNLQLIIGVNVGMTILMGVDIFLQARKYERTKEILEKLSREQLKEFLLKSMLRMGGSQQIREFRNMLYEKAKENIENIKDNIKENIKDKILPKKENGEDKENI
jgi:uncharacterized membrane protein